MGCVACLRPDPPCHRHSLPGPRGGAMVDSWGNGPVLDLTHRTAGSVTTTALGPSHVKTIFGSAKRNIHPFTESPQSIKLMS